MLLANYRCVGFSHGYVDQKTGEVFSDHTTMHLLVRLADKNGSGNTVMNVKLGGNEVYDNLNLKALGDVCRRDGFIKIEAFIEQELDAKDRPTFFAQDFKLPELSKIAVIPAPVAQVKKD